jgi:conjugal transfer pilus assembly protein TraU
VILRKTLFSGISILFVFSFFSPLSNADSSNTSACQGKFANPITDVCWDCAMPIVLFSGVTLGSEQQDYDSGVNESICSCPVAPPLVETTGVHVSFWEFARQMDVTKTPFCMVSLGTSIPLPTFSADTELDSTDDADNTDTAERGSTTIYRQVHWYINPLLAVMQIILDNNCLEVKGFDLLYYSEVDPTHTEEDLDRILNPEDYMFGGMPAIISCIPDAVAATVGFAVNDLFWCDGVNGPIGSLTGFVPETGNGGDVPGSTRYITRLIKKMHRLGTQWTGAGPNAMCGYYPEIVMKKDQYKYSMLYPSPQSQPDALGRCCQVLGAPSDLWGAGRSYPYQGEDFAYAIFRKRDCCQSIPGSPGAQ